MKKICVCFLLLVSSSSFGQFNLVPNPSFEDTVSCPTTANQLDKAVGWHASRESPDYFNECNFNTSSGVTIPNNFVGYQYPRTGNAYVGFLGYYYPFPNGREFFTCQLLAPLIIGRNYLLTFYISWSAGSPSDLIACNKLGLKFTNANYFLPSNPLTIDNKSNLYTDTIVRDSLGWFKISGSFIADSSYNYLSIGNFFDDNQTDTIMPGFPSADAYYYVDDVSVIEDTITSVSELNPLGDVKIHPNPASDFTAISFDKSQDAAIRLVDLLGNTILTTEVINKKECSINVSAVAAGCYFLQIVNKRTGTTTTKKIIII